MFLKTKILSSKTPLLGGGSLDFILVSPYPTRGKRFFNISKVAFFKIPLLGGGSLNQQFSDPPPNKGKLKISWQKMKHILGVLLIVFLVHALFDLLATRRTVPSQEFGFYFLNLDDGFWLLESRQQFLASWIWWSPFVPLAGIRFLIWLQKRSTRYSVTDIFSPKHFFKIFLWENG